MTEKAKISENLIVFPLISPNTPPITQYSENFNFDYNEKSSQLIDHGRNPIKVLEKNDMKNVKENEKLKKLNQNLLKMCEIVKIAVTDFNR